MARSRNIKPGFFLNDTLAEVEPIGRLLFIGLWTIADREGRLEDRPKKIKAAVLPYDDADVDALLGKLAERGFITRYSVADTQLIQVVNWAKHQLPHHKEQASTLPAPDMPGTNPGQAPGKSGACPSDSLNLIPDSLNPQPDASDKPAGNVTPIEFARKKGAEIVDLGEGFESFYRAYPKKRGKQDASKAWFKLKPSAELRATIMAALEQHKASREWLKQDGEFVPYPATWLNQARWEDELDTERRAGTGPVSGRERRAFVVG